MSRLIKSGYIFILLAICSQQAFAQKVQTPAAPGLSFVGQLNVKIGPAYVVGETPHGLRRIIPILGGTVEGPGLKGEILPGGSDWQVVRKDGVAELEAHYQFKTDDGVIIYIKNVGLRVATPDIAARIGRGEQVSPNEYYFRAIPKFEAPAGKYDWMNNAIFICTAFRNPENVVIQVWKVL
ncbi:DUF3237 domain-containing protein [Spirosoma fluviale]|uniref:UPF0311 protein SAMN06269250_1480 n=1 Tax=Spirosoma fluviale TaxID=1597977 RepID=A0A286FBL6_9BACT|nr:DUF3237 domain-containing protein [Spirosoma fluviale]SOD80593.1 Protein of unknown function [Spirosoma fluviale]